MQIIFLLLISTLAFAQKGSGPVQCDPVEAEKQCFNLLCTSTPKKLIPSDREELFSAIRSHNYELHPDIVKDFGSLGALSESVKAATLKALSEGKEKAIAEDFLKKPVEGMRLMDVLFEGELRCIYQDGQCALISSDMDSYSEGMKEAFRNLSESTYVFRQGVTMTMKDKKDHLLKALEKMSPHKDKAFIKQEKKKISRMKREFDYIMYSNEASWFEDYFKLVSNENARYLPDIAEALKSKMESMVKLDLSSNEARSRVFQSCRIASYVKSTVDQNVTPQKFQEQKNLILHNFKSKFLPKLSSHSAKKLSDILEADPFVLIEHNQNFHPYSPNLSVHRDGYVAPENNFDLMRDLTLLNQGRTFRCSLGGLLVSDSFNFGTGYISVSKFVLANGYGDAMSHELGHWFSAQLKHKNVSWHSRQKIWKVRKCLRKNYPSERAGPTYHLQHSGDRFRTEEDFADWFAAKAGLGENGLFCDLKKVSINLGGTPLENSYLPQHGDPHSNYLFRELSLRLNRGEILPQSCKDLIDSYPESQPQKCDL